jgi:hypothetical protein
MYTLEDILTLAHFIQTILYEILDPETAQDFDRTLSELIILAETDPTTAKLKIMQKLRSNSDIQRWVTRHRELLLIASHENFREDIIAEKMRSHNLYMPSFSNLWIDEKSKICNPIFCNIQTEMDSHIVVNRVTTVDVTLSPEAIALINQATNKNGNVEIDPTKTLILQLIPKVNFESISESQIEIESPTIDKPETFYFDVKPTHLGEGEIWIVVRQSHLPILTLKLTPTIVESRATAQRLSAQGIIQPQPNFSEPPHILDITEQRNGTQISYQYELRSPSLNLLQRYNSKPLNRDRKEYIDHLYKEIESRWTSTQGDVEAFTEELRAFGGELLDELFPDMLKHHLWKHRHQLESIMVTSTEPFIPWELIHLKPADQNALPEETCFLGQLGLVRWLYDIGYPPETLTLRSDRCHYIIPHYPDNRYRLPQAEEEAHFLEQNFQATAIDPQTNSVRQALKAGSFDLLHFAGHGEADPGSSNAKLLLQGRIEESRYIPESLSETTVKQYCQFKAAKPIVLLNACQIGRTGYALTGVSGFAQAFLKGGAGAFIGTLWSVGDRPARIFSETLYTALLEGNTLSEATRKARKAAQTSGDATWLAYVVYGHPNLTITLQSTKEK